MPANTSSHKLLDSFTKKVGETYTAPLFPTAAAGYEYYDYNDSGWSPESTVTIGRKKMKQNKLIIPVFLCIIDSKWVLKCENKSTSMQEVLLNTMYRR